MTTIEIYDMDAVTLCDKMTFIGIFDSESQFEQAQLEETALERATKLGIEKKFTRLLKAFKAELKKSMTGNAASVEKSISYKGHEYSLGGWTLSNGGICHYSERWGYVYACPHQILMVKRLKNLETKKEKAVIAFDRDGWTEIVVPKSMICSNSKIVALSDYGVLLSSESAKPLVRYLADMEAANDIELVNSTSKYGWHDGEFIPYDKKVAFDADSQFKSLNDSLEPKGSYETWTNLVKEIRRYSHVHYETQLFMAGAVASVLVRMTSALPFILNIWGGSGGGKTVALMVAASIWADPSEGRFMVDALSTQNAFEVREDILNDLPLLIDDFSKVSKRFGDDFSELIYMITSGKGKSRSNLDLGLNPMKTWGNACLSNMERPLIDDNLKGGQVNRVLDFEMDEGKIFGGNGIPLTGNYVAETVKANYGFAGKKIIEIIKGIGRESIKELLDKNYKKIKKIGEEQEKNIEDKQVLSFALILTGDYVLEKIFNDGIYIDVDKCITQLKTADDVQETNRVYDYIMDTVEQNIKKFEDDDNYHGEIWGFIRDGYVNIIPKVFNRIAIDGNFSVKAFCHWADKANLLRKSDKNRFQFIGRRNSSEGTKRYYSLLMHKDDVDADGFMKVDGDIPFSDL